jgi:hypothetical protein
MLEIRVVDEDGVVVGHLELEECRTRVHVSRQIRGRPDRAGGGTRTHGLTITSRLRFQLRHTGVGHRLSVPLEAEGVRTRHDPGRSRGRDGHVERGYTCQIGALPVQAAAASVPGVPEVSCTAPSITGSGISVSELTGSGVTVVISTRRGRTSSPTGRVMVRTPSS